MKFFRKTISIIIVFALLFLTLPASLPGLVHDVFAAGTITVDVAKDSGLRPILSQNSVTLSWNKINNAQSYAVFYRDSAGNLQYNTLTTDMGSSVECAINGLDTDILYRFMVVAYSCSVSDLNSQLGSGDTDTNKLTSGTTDVLTGITLTVKSEDETPVSMPGGGMEVGANPKLDFSWKVPQVWSDVDITKPGSYQNIDNSEIDYNINLGTDTDGLNLTQLKVRFDSSASQYIVTRYADNDIKTVAGSIYQSGQDMGFTCQGGSGQASIASNSDYPSSVSLPGATSVFDSGNIGDFSSLPAGTAVDLSNIYEDPDLTPGTVLRMSIEPVLNSASAYNNATFLRGSIAGGYTFTPVRLQLAKDDAGNLIATIYKVDQSTLDSKDMLSFTYEVQYDTDPNFTNFITSARQTDEFSQGQNTMTIFIENKNYANTYYYRVIAWSPNESEVLYSSPIGYALSQDIPQAPLPENLYVESVAPETGSVENTFYTPVNGESYNVRSAKVELRWDKPANYDQIMQSIASNPDDTVYYHILLSTAQTDVPGAKGVIGNIFGDPAKSTQYDIKYRDALDVNIGACISVNDLGNPDPNGDYLEYTIDGMQLFSTAEPGVDPVQDLSKNTDSYPTYLLPNTIYYLKMFTEKDKLTTPPQSDNSIPVTFTTPQDVQKNPPAPVNFKVVQNGDETQNACAPIVLQWDKLNFDINDYVSVTDAAYKPPYDIKYELYMSDSTDDSSFVLLDTATEGSISSGDVSFDGQQNATSNVIAATINNFSAGSAAYNKFGSGLKPNTTYYFKLKTEVDIQGETSARNSDFTQILSVTTLKGQINPPGDDEKLPMMPSNFSVALDQNGNPIYDSSSATLTWTGLEPDVQYTLIRTAVPVDSTETLQQIQSDPKTLSKVYFSGIDTTYADPNFKYDSTDNNFTYTVSDLNPNTVYYFELRAERTVTEPDGITQKLLVSQWNMITLTTTLIEAPSQLNIVQDYQLGASWTANNAFMPDDFVFTVNGVQLAKGSVQVSKQPISTGSGTINMFYVRIPSLKADTSYKIVVSASPKLDENGVLQTFTTQTLVPSGGTITRDPMHEIEVSWIGKDGYNFELAVKDDGTDDYKALHENPSQDVSDGSKYDSVHFKYTSVEKPANLVGTNYSMYYAVIYGLQSNTKYYVKVRSVSNIVVTQSDGTQVTVPQYSNYIGPVSSRTDFSQSDYDNGDQGQQDQNDYNDEVNKYNNALYWIMGNSSTTFAVKLRADRCENYIEYGNHGDLVLDLTQNGNTSINRTLLYIPLSIVDMLNSNKKSLVVETVGAKYTLRPGFIDTANSQIINNLKNEIGVQDVYIYIELDNQGTPSLTYPTGTSIASNVQNVVINALGMWIPDSAIENTIHTQFQSYVQGGLTTLNSMSPTSLDTPQELNNAIANIISGIDVNLRNFVLNYITGANIYPTKIDYTLGVASLDIPLEASISMSTSASGTKKAYLYSSSTWQALATTVSGTTASFESAKTGQFVILITGLDTSTTLPDNYWAKADITSFASKYDLNAIFGTMTQYVMDSTISMKETALLMEEVLNGSLNGVTGSTQTIAKQLGIDKIVNFNIPTRVLEREELAALTVDVYASKSGVSMNSLKPVRVITIKDGNSIDDVDYNNVALSLDWKVMTLDSNGNFSPSGSCTRAQAISVLARTLRMLGEL